MTSAIHSLLLHGSPEPLPRQLPLRAGPLALVFEAGDLRYVTLHGREVVRRIYGAVRDREWRTIPGALTGLHIDAQGDRFIIRYRSEHREQDVHFVWTACIEGSTDGEVVFDFAGEARSSFERNRIGLCVLHPVRGYAGTPARAHGSNGRLRGVRFPTLVAIEQPIDGFIDLAGLTCDDGAVEMLFTGDVFETEDQRNWIDASFKTYSTPLSLARPVRVAAGTRVEQRVTLRVRPEARPRGGRTPRGALTRQLPPSPSADRVIPAIGTAIEPDEG